MSAEKKGYISEIKSHTGVNVNRCYQCGKCSAGCAVNEEMDFPPSVVMRMLQTNNAENYKEINPCNPSSISKISGKATSSELMNSPY